MELFDFFYPEQAQAAGIRNISRTMASQMRMAAVGSKASDAIREDVSFLALVTMSMVGLLVEKGVITQEEVSERIRKLDELDGVKDGKLNPDAVRGALGLPRAETPKTRPSASRFRRLR